MWPRRGHLAAFRSVFMWPVGALICALFVVLNATSCTETVKDNGFVAGPAGPLRWTPHMLPQALIVSPHLRAWRPHFDEARGFWGSVVGREVFLEPTWGLMGVGEPKARAVFLMSSPDLDHPTTEWWQAGDGAMLMAVIHIPAGLHAEATPEQMTIVAHHELGHCLGLDDDQAPESIMHGRIDENLDFKARLRVTAKDKELLRDAYRQVPPPLGHGF